jgi:Transglutaminase-like superfamily
VKTFIHRSQTFWSLTSAEREIAWAAARGLTATWLGLRFLGFRRWKEFVERRVERANAGAVQPRISAVAAQRIVQLEEAAARNLPFKTNCLEQSLVLWPLLRRRGFSAELKFGARKDAGKFEAHAWVELDGEALNNDSEENRGFVPFDGAVAATQRHAE